MKRYEAKKLYNRIQNLSVPESVYEFGGLGHSTYRVDYQTWPTSVHVTWPSGKPCLAVNMYLLEKCYSSTGDSVVTTAAKLSELIRYCSNGRLDGKPCGFHELKDSDIAQLVKKLCSDTYVGEQNERVRNNNTVRAIMHTVFDFLEWYQDNLLVNGRRLIGARSQGAAIVVKIKQNSHSRRSYIDHRYLPPPVSMDPKLPIDTSMIEAIESKIDDLELRENYCEAALRRFNGDDQYMDNYLAYQSARRNFMIFMMRSTGLRPEEMARMSVANNNKSSRMDKPFLILPTMKRRSLEPPLRNFPITDKQAWRVKIYLRSREKWLAFCANRTSTIIDTDAMFLSVGPGSLGKPVGKGALQKDFRELCILAGFRNQQSCFSMFRHRFITDLVHMHLIAFDGKKGELNKQDYRTLLEKVREKTGHKSIDSLWHYIDLVRGMAGVWDPVNLLIKVTQDAEQLRHELREARKLFRQGVVGGSTSTEIADCFEEPVNKFLKASKNIANKEFIK
jgi:hypothetical protein